MTAPGITVTRCTLDEIPLVLDLWRRAGVELGVTDTADDLSRLVQDSRAALLIAVRGTDIVGSVIATSDSWRGNIYRLAVAPDARRGGLARMLVAHAGEFLRALGVKRIGAPVDQTHPWAIAFWDSLEALGYRRELRDTRYVKNVGR